ncbi:MAG TPA: DUF1003 domain-containing protein [Candidatus Saccharimonadales bacterium]|nr:DUF1003 domain-containing protein [Candidatus Saccharimonadales bacterium]
MTLEQPNRHKPQNVNTKHQAGLGFQDKLALVITTAVGTMYAVYFFIVALAGWMLWQGVISKHPFDPYPFAFLLFMGNIVQLLLMPLIMVGQNIQARHSELRADEEYKTTLSSYHDLETILKHLNAQDEAIMRQTKILQELLEARK